MSNEMELAEITQRLNDLRAIPLQGGKLTREQLREGFELLAKATSLRAGRVSKAKAEKGAADTKLGDLF
jgi:hypothetical protein